MQEYFLEMKEITKIFPGVRALDHVDVSVKRGEIHALVGENGAGKSTLIKILCGVYTYGTYAGSIILDGEEQRFASIRDVEQAGIACIHQELNLCNDLSIAENIFLNNKPSRFGIVNFDEMNQRTANLLRQVGLSTDSEDSIKPQELVRNLGIGQKQLVEIAKALSINAKLLILDEPTSALTEFEANQLLALVCNLRDNGVTCIYISHKLDEVMSIADSATVLRDGTVVARLAREEMSKARLISSMVGRTLDKQFPREEHTQGEVIMEVKNYSIANPDIPGATLIKNVSFRLHKGEILGISGLMGAGRTELMTSIYGAYRAMSSGEVYIAGKRVHIHSPSDALREGLFLVSEDRKRFGLNLIMTVKENITLSALKAISSSLGIINRNAEIQEVTKYVDMLRIKTPSSEVQAQNLSGGNQQKVVIAKALMSKAKIIVLDEPTRGIDVGTKYEIYKIMNELVDKGVAIIMISSELEEIMGISDRILVMSAGRFTAEFRYDEATQHKIMAASTGGVKQS